MPFFVYSFQRAGSLLKNRLALQHGPIRLSHKNMEECCWPGDMTVMYDADAVGLMQVEDFKHNNYYALWLKVSEKADCHLLPECLAKLRTPQSTIMEFLFTDKLNWRYQVYRREYGNSPFIAGSMTVRSLWFSLIKRVKYKG